MPQGTPIISFVNGSTNFHFLVSEANGYQSREEITIASGQGKLKGGTVIAKTGTTYHAWVPADTTNAAILASDVDATSAAVKVTAFVRIAEVQRAELFFTGTPTTPQKDAAYALLAAANIVMR